MVNDYKRVVDRALRYEPRRPALPAHLLADGGRVLDKVAAEFGVQPLPR
jgi:hypothetical protein